MEEKNFQRSRRLAELVAAARAATEVHAGEATELLFRALVALPPARLKDGTEVRFEPFFAPRADDDGAWSCGVDVRFGDGSYLEFILANTGWGRPMNHSLTQPPQDKPQRSR